MKNYNIPIIYQRVSNHSVQANSLEEAMVIALKEFLAIPDDDYLADSFEFDSVIEDYQEEFDTEKVEQKVFNDN